MSEILVQYGLFLAQAVTVVVAIVVTIGAVVAIIALATVAAASRRGGQDERLEVRRLNARYEGMARTLRREILPKKLFKQMERTSKRDRKARTQDTDEGRKRYFVLDFRGDLRASAVSSLREEVSAVLQVARPAVDEVVLRLENAGGLVHDHGLAACQLLRLRARELDLTVTVDKVAASGGYMMACTGNRVLAAPFAVLGSIGVLAQLPNFHRLLEAHGIEFEQVMGGEHKRTLTVFGKNTDADRAKMRAEVEDTHGLFKDFVSAHRPGVELARVATGEHWYGRKALELGLCDELATSDEYLCRACEEGDVFSVSLQRKATLARKLALAARGAAGSLLGRWWSHERDRQLTG